MKSVYEAPDEFMAITIRSLLENEGIEVLVKSYQISMFDGIAQVMKSVWGKLLVTDEDYERASSMVNEYLDSQDEAPEKTEG
jgi:hypothetical protein